MGVRILRRGGWSVTKGGVVHITTPHGPWSGLGPLDRLTRYPRSSPFQWTEKFGPDQMRLGPDQLIWVGPMVWAEKYGPDQSQSSSLDLDWSQNYTHYGRIRIVASRWQQLACRRVFYLVMFRITQGRIWLACNLYLRWTGFLGPVQLNGLKFK